MILPRVPLTSTGPCTLSWVVQGQLGPEAHTQEWPCTAQSAAAVPQEPSPIPVTALGMVLPAGGPRSSPESQSVKGKWVRALTRR